MPRVVCDEHGFVRGFPYHDGHLHGVVVDSVSGDAHLAFSAVSGEDRVLSLRGVKSLEVQGFRQGNIILSLQVLLTSSIASEPLACSRNRSTRRWLWLYRKHGGSALM